MVAARREPGRASSYFVQRGFSGAPVFDAVGNVTWAMIVAVDDNNHQVAFSIPAEDLRRALGSVGRPLSDDVPPPAPPGPVDDLARDAVTQMREEFERRLDEQRVWYEQQMEDLRRGIAAVAKEARDEPGAEEEVTRALQRLKAGEPEEIERLLETMLGSAPTILPEERLQAADLARALGRLLDYSVACSTK